MLCGPAAVLQASVFDGVSFAVEFLCRGLVDARLLLEAEELDGLEAVERADGVGVCGILGGFEADLNVALSREVVDLVGLCFLHDADEVGGIGHVAVVQDKPTIGLLRILVEVVDAAGVE